MTISIGSRGSTIARSPIEPPKHCHGCAGDHAAVDAKRLVVAYSLGSLRQGHYFGSKRTIAAGDGIPYLT
jgi:hypothetical protein